MKSRRLTNILLVVLLIILIGFLAYYLFAMRDSSWGDSSKNTASSTQTQATTSSAVATSSLVAPALISSIKITDHNLSADYAVDATYPKVSGIDNVSAASINANISSLVQSEISSFKDSLPDNSDPSNTSTTSISDESTLQLNYSSSTASLFPTIQNFVIQESSYASGGAHQTDTAFALNYNVTDGSLLSLGDIFQKGSNYLSVISTYVKSDLSKQLSAKNNIANQDMINAGAGASEDNFQQFVITNSGLKIIFNEYQVADYAAGQLTVTIPWSVLHPVLNPNGPVNL